MTRMITAMFDSRAEADAAADHLVRDLLLNRAAVRVHGDGSRVDAPSAASVGEEDRGFWAALRDLFVPDEDRTTYAEGLRRGSFLVSAEVEEDQIDDAMDVLESHGAVDLENREAQWRASGWSGEYASDAATTLPTSPEIGVAGTTNEPVIARPGGAGGDFSNHPAPGSMTNEQGRMAGAGNTAPMTPASGAAPRRASATARDEVIPLAEERVQIGKRDVERGRVRVRSYVVETPVNEQVTLHSENVEVERRAVDRAARPGDDLFRERTIEAVEHGEEAVVAKETRVTGEVVMRKDATERTETVQDTVRRTEVDVQDETGGKTPGATSASPPDGAPGNPPGTMASRAVDRTLGTDLSDKNKTRKP